MGSISKWKPILLHTVAVIIAVLVALGVAKIVGWDQPAGLVAMTAVAALLEKLVRLLTIDWVNE